MIEISPSFTQNSLKITEKFAKNIFKHFQTYLKIFHNILFFIFYILRNFSKISINFHWNFYNFYIKFTNHIDESKPVGSYDEAGAGKFFQFFVIIRSHVISYRQIYFLLYCTRLIAYQSAIALVSDFTSSKCN